MGAFGTLTQFSQFILCDANEQGRKGAKKALFAQVEANGKLVRGPHDLLFMYLRAGVKNMLTRGVVQILIKSHGAFSHVGVNCGR